MTTQANPTKAMMIADRALLVELAEQSLQARKAAAETDAESALNVLASDAQKARDCAIRAQVLLAVARATQVAQRHEEALALAIEGHHEKVWDYFDAAAEALRG